MLPLFLGKITSGRLALQDKDKFNRYLLGLEGKEIELTLGKRRQKRSLQANAFYHGVFLPIMAEAIGELDPEELCQDLRKKFLSYKKVVKGKERTYTLSTAQLSKEDMALYLDKVLVVAAQMDIVIPDPTEIKLTN